MEKDAAETWSEVWTTPTLTAFSNSFKENYDGSILKFWESQITGNLDHVVDLACGNGALTWIANDLLNCNESKTKVTGIDYAEIDPFEVLARNPEDYPQVSFIGNTGIESLPFTDGSVDLVISQYGLEYSNLDQSIPEIIRVLSPSGKMAFIMHDADGELARNAIETAEDFRTVNDIIRCDELILELGQIHDKSVSPKSDVYQALLEKINVNLNLIQSIYNKHPEAWLLGDYKSRLEQAFQEAQKASNQRQFNIENMLQKTRQVFTTTTEVKEDLARASLDKKDRKLLMKMIRQAGFTITENRVLEQQPGINWGTMIAAKRNPSGTGILGRLKKILPG